MMLADGIAAVMASLTANAIVFHLWEPALGLYLCASGISGITFGYLGSILEGRVQLFMGQYQINQYEVSGYETK